jgi:hypothetical protein
VIFPINEIEMPHLRMNGCAGTALLSKWSLQSSQRIKSNHSSPSKAAGDGVGRVVGFLGDGWRVAGKLRTNPCEEATFLRIEKVTKLKANRGTSNLTPTRQLSLEWSVEKGLVKRDGRWWSERRSSNESAGGLRFSYFFNRSFELEFTRDYYGKPKRHDKLVAFMCYLLHEDTFFEKILTLISALAQVQDKHQFPQPTHRKKLDKISYKTSC